MTKAYHLEIDDTHMAGNGGLGRYVFLPGSPKRAARLADLFEDRETVQTSRGLDSHYGRLVRGDVSVDVAVVPTGMGVPSVDIVVSELLDLGVRRLLRIGTTGTLMGVSQCLKQQRTSIRIVGAEPNPGHTIQGLKNMTESIVPAIYDRSRLDDVLPMDDDTAFDMCRELAHREGIFAGISGGAAVAAAVQLAKDMTSGTIVTIIPDRGDRYLSDTHFRSVCAECSP